MKKIIILVAMLLLGVNSINAARRAVYLSFSNNGLSGKKENANRAPMHLPVNVVYDSDASIATINQQGILTVKENGVVQILAQSDDISYSKTIIVGLPRYILSSKHEPGGFKIDATCIDGEYQNQLETVNKIVQFQWGVKFPDKSIEWNTTNSASIFIPLENKDAVVFFKVCDSNGRESVVQSVKASGNDVFLPTNNHIKVDGNKNIYKENGSSYSYKRGKLYLTRDTSLPTEYQRANWTAMEADVYSPFSNQYNIIVDGGEIMLKNILPEEELDYVVSNLEVGQTYTYTIALKNPQKKVIQLYNPQNETFNNRKTKRI